MGTNKLGKPRLNQNRSVTKKEKLVLKMRKTHLFVVGTSNGFDLLDKQGQQVKIEDEQRMRLMHFWELPVARWDHSNFLR